MGAENQRKMNIVFFGSSAYVLPLIQILNAEYNLELVVTTEQKETDAVPHFCITNKIPYLSVTNVKTDAFLTQIRDLGAPVAVLADFGLLIPQDLIGIFPKGIVNIHPSLLPKFRGPTPGQSAILAGEHETGVSIMLLDQQLDHGPILAQEKASIEQSDTADTLYTRLFTIGSSLLAKSLRSYLDNSLVPTPQDDSKATYTKILTKQDGFFDVDKIVILERQNASIGSHQDLEDSIASLQNDAKIITSEKLHRMVRACHPWPGVWTKMNLYGKEKIVKLLPSSYYHVIPAKAGIQSIPNESKDGSPIRSGMTNQDPVNDILLQVEGKKPMSVKDFINGYPETKTLFQKLGLF